MNLDPRLLPDRPFDRWHAPRIFAHTLFSHLRDHRRAPRGNPPPGPVFVVGSPRSGTTFLGAALARIPGTSYQFEPVAVKAAVPYIWSGIWPEEKSRRLVTGVHTFLKAIQLEQGRTLIEKTPRNVFIVPQLSRWYPEARFVGLIRDGRDVAASWSQRPWLASRFRRRCEPGGYRYGPRPPFWVEPERIEEFATTSTEHRCIWGWRAHTEQWLRVREDLDPGRWLEVRYEELVSEPLRHAEKLAGFLGLDGPARIRLEAALASARPGSVGAWRTSPVASDPRALAEAAELLDRLGYR